MTRFIIIVGLFLSACNYNAGNRNSAPDFPSSDELKYKVGDCLYFKASDSTYGSLIVCDFSKEVGGIWYGTFYTGYDSPEIPSIQSIIEGRVMGRKVQSSIDKDGYRTCLDGDFIIDTLFTNRNLFTLIGNIKLKRIELGSHGALSSMQLLRSTFHQRKQLRLKTPDHYSEHMSKLDKFRPEEYFAMRSFIR